LLLFRGRALFALLLGSSIVACGLGSEFSQIVTSPNGLKTFTWSATHDGIPISCGAPATTGLTGTLAGSATDPERLWLITQEGRRVSVVWPAGFEAVFSPKPRLIGRSQETFASEGDAVELRDVNPAGAQGTPSDPFIAAGHVFGDCYVYWPSV